MFFLLIRLPRYRHLIVIDPLLSVERGKAIELQGHLVQDCGKIYQFFIA